MKWDWRFAQRKRACLHNARQMLIALDQCANALIGLILGVAGLLYALPRPAGLWWADETISAHCWRWQITGVRRWPRVLVDFLASCLGDRDHCRKSYESEENGLHLPREVRHKT